MTAQIRSLVPGEHDAFLKAHNTIKSIYTKSSVEKNSSIGYFINQTNNKWKESRATHPNDPKFSELYSTYNNKCKEKFEKGAYWLVENGLHSDIDPLFRSFVISKPELMHRRIIDTYRNVAVVVDENANSNRKRRREARKINRRRHY